MIFSYARFEINNRAKLKPCSKNYRAASIEIGNFGPVDLHFTGKCPGFPRQSRESAKRTPRYSGTAARSGSYIAVCSGCFVVARWSVVALEVSCFWRGGVAWFDGIRANHEPLAWRSE